MNAQRPDRALLQVRDVDAGYGSHVVVKHASLMVEPGSIVSLLGPNGAGKSTLLKAIGGIVKVFAGSVALGGVEITHLRTEQLAGHGIGYVPQLNDVFATLTVQENLEMGGYLLPGESVRGEVERIFTRFPKLAALAGRRAATLSGGERKLLAVARALMRENRILLLDEPTAGLSPAVRESVLGETIRGIADSGVGVLMVEQQARAALEVSDWALVLINGEVCVSETASELAGRGDLGELLIGRRQGKLAAPG